MDTANLIRAKAAAYIMGMSMQRFHYYIKEKRVPGIVRIGKTLFFDKTILKNWEPEDRRKKPTT